MKLSKMVALVLTVFAVFTSCNNDDDATDYVELRDAGVVYSEDIVEIETYLETHFYNYEEFAQNAPYSLENDVFEIVFDTIAGDNADKTPLIDMVSSKIVDFDDIEYTLYYLNVREGLGKEVHFSDQATLTYEGISVTDNYVFDSASTEAQFNLLTVGSSSGVVPGFQQALIEFKTSDDFTDNNDGTTTYHNHGIGAVFIPSGLGYFNLALAGVDAYTPLIFKFNMFKRAILDHDIDGIPTYMEDIDGNGDAYDDDTNGNFTPDFLDNDDDGDGYYTEDELEYASYEIMSGDPDPVFADNEFEKSRVENNGIIYIESVIVTDRDGDGTPDYLDYDTIPE
ncbi:FKBP-type peptidyl-prolyl cis-trans isomerase [Bizionia sp. KMM 8389]